MTKDDNSDDGDNSNNIINVEIIESQLIFKMNGIIPETKSTKVKIGDNEDISVGIRFISERTSEYIDKIIGEDFKMKESSIC